MISEKTQENIDYIMDNFDFEKCNDVMHYLNWQYHHCNGIPTTYDLRSMARRQIKSVIEELSNNDMTMATISCGGFSVSGYKEIDSDEIWFELKFVLTEWDNRD